MGQRGCLYGEDKTKRGGKNKKAKTLGRKRKVPRDPYTLSHVFPSGIWMPFTEPFRHSGVGNYIVFASLRRAPGMALQ